MKSSFESFKSLALAFDKLKLIVGGVARADSITCSFNLLCSSGSTTTPTKGITISGLCASESKDECYNYTEALGASYEEMGCSYNGVSCN